MQKMKNRMDTNLTPLQFGVHTNWEPFCYLSVLTQIWPVVLQKREAFPILEFGVLMSLVIIVTLRRRRKGSWTFS